MKKILVLLLALAMIFAFCACGEKKEETKNPEQSGIQNPWKDYESLDALNEDFGGRLAKPELMQVSNESFTGLSTDNEKIAQYVFTYDGFEYTLRYSPDFEKDISGLYQGDKTVFADMNLEANIATDKFKASKWLTVDGQYVLSVSDDNKLDSGVFSSIADDIKSVTTPSDATDELDRSGNPDEDMIAPYAGSYTDSFSQRASLDLVPTGDGNGYTVLIAWGSGSYETDTWVMSVNYSAEGMLYYNDGVHQRHNWEATGEDKITTIAENQEGYFYIDGEKICWIGAPEEDCRECVFEK